MDKRYTAIIKQNGQWWIGWIEEILGVNCQEATKEELLESLQETLREALDAAGDSFEETSIII
jgi:predicted RNase H-like HicB family nuclease